MALTNKKKQPNPNRPQARSSTPLESRRLLKRWRSWAEPLREELGNLFVSRELFRELASIVDANPGTLDPPTFLNWIRSNYVASIAIGIRRLTDTDKRSRSLGRLLVELYEHPGVLTREFHYSLYSTRTRELAQGAFDAAAGPRATDIPRRKVRSDLRAMEIAEQRVRRFVNKRIAHKGHPRDLRRGVTFLELHNALEVVDSIFLKYYRVLTANGLRTTEPVIQTNWKRPLHLPWIPPDARRDQ